MTKVEAWGKRACKTVEEKMDSAIKTCWHVSRADGGHLKGEKINCYRLHEQRGKLVKACRKL